MKNNKEKVSYLVFGVLTTIVNIVCYFLLADILHVSYTLSTFYAWTISVIFAFITNKIYVFNSRKAGMKEVFLELFWFIFYRIVSLIIDLLLMIFLVELLSTNDLFAKAVSNIVVIVFNYLVSKMIIFKSKEHIKHTQE
ncbi:GtrA family protein [Metabacillus arenae]|uniref:GtrA family protein n=1 Tax=Metabacillus arenae TaxID=2771434 RepID=A0A926NDB4_9BACI|nr:GtrA family protein [Metabacillus arenae]MBD1381374.1 GtrA family protein [Metabacillus arenae]